jgi:hypothetical protein
MLRHPCPYTCSLAADAASEEEKRKLSSASAAASHPVHVSEVLQGDTGCTSGESQAGGVRPFASLQELEFGSGLGHLA